MCLLKNRPAYLFSCISFVSYMITRTRREGGRKKKIPEMNFPTLKKETRVLSFHPFPVYLIKFLELSR